MTQANTTISYRPDIDGLRAIAVLAVVLYHYDIGPLQGGFVGVDVFFVISGYLITGIIHREISESRFTFANFYERRIRRIFPALAAMLFATLLVGALLLLPSDLVRLGNASVATIGFVANVLYWRQSGYFDTSSEYNPLLHTWSLAVEEQFYIGLPILLILVQRYAGASLRQILLICAILSFALCVWMQPLRPTAVFFLSPFRAWELMLGGLMAIGAAPQIKGRTALEAVSLLAFLCLMGSLYWIQAGPQFPGWQASIPVVATAVLLHTGSHGATVATTLLSLRPLVFIGLVSYSLYLWHWPLLVFTRYVNAMESLSPLMTWGLLLLALILSYASYRWVEKPFRRQQSTARQTMRNPVFLVAGMTMVGLVGLAWAVKCDQGWQRRFSADVVGADRSRNPVIPFKECDGVSPANGRGLCTLGAERVAPDVLLWGDSHALAWAPAFDAAGRERGWSAALAAGSACPPLLDVINPVDPNCLQNNRHTLDWIKNARPDTVYLVASWVSYSVPVGGYEIHDEFGRHGNMATFAPALQRTIDALKGYVGRVVLIGPTPGAPTDIPFKLALTYHLGKLPPAPVSRAEVDGRSVHFWRAVRGLQTPVSYVDPVEWFCDGSACQYEHSGQLLYRDGGHLSLAGAAFVAARFPEFASPVKNGDSASRGIKP